LLACILAAPFGRQLTISMEQINFHQVSERNETNNSKTICCTLFLPNFKGNVIATKEKSSEFRSHDDDVDADAAGIWWPEGTLMTSLASGCETWSDPDLAIFHSLAVAVAGWQNPLQATHFSLLNDFVSHKFRWPTIRILDVNVVLSCLAGRIPHCNFQ